MKPSSIKQKKKVSRCLSLLKKGSFLIPISELLRIKSTTSITINHEIFTIQNLL